ncbi:MAG: alpha-L-fucosidase [Bacteroidales bacterium]|nr:alpha-L-fucosidase [Bacteroidales bacterium]
MKLLKSLTAGILMSSAALTCAAETATYTPAPENLEARERFSNDRFGIFIHWGIYSMFGQGEWYLNNGLSAEEYAKAARGFYPADFNAEEWVTAIKNSGAKYITITTRHHDGFSMFATKQSPYNIVDATPYGRDIIKELADECARQGITLNFYYSHLDWSHPAYPTGWSGINTGRDPEKFDWPTYYKFMNDQLTELLTNYGPVGAIWFDGMWDHDPSREPDFDWNLTDQYALIHSLQPACMIGNNHHKAAYPGEDFQIFERDLPGENTAGFSEGQQISPLPLETCNTVNGNWGYNVTDTGYKSTDELVRYLVKAAGMGANLLLNVGPQPSGALPAVAVERLKGVGDWLNIYGETIYGTKEGDFPAQEWGTTTRKGNKLYVHVMTPESADITLPLTAKVKKAVTFDNRTPVKFTHNRKDNTVTLHLDKVPQDIDYIIELETK